MSQSQAELVDSNPSNNTTLLDAYYLHPDSIDLSTSQSESLDENVLSEDQLRELYDTEEIQRFLRLFSAYVTEVQAPDSPAAKQSSAEGSFFNNESNNDYLEHQSEESGDWTPLHTSQKSFHPVSRTASLPESGPYQSISEKIACRCIIPILPPPRPSPSFTLSRLHLGTERLYLATIPIYGPFLRRLHGLATWKNPTMSMIYCMIFWTLWWYNLLAPALVIRILISLLKRRIFPYPSVEDLRRHREEILRADEFGEQVSIRLSMKASNVKEIWRLFRLFGAATKNKAKSSAKDTSSGNDEKKSSDEHANEMDTTLETVDDTEEVQDFKKMGLHLLEEVADLHERIRNIFIWRRPSSSRLYGIALSSILFLSFFPTKYIVKSLVFVIAFIFWHVIPVIMALPSPERKRLPAPFNNVPTDAEYAMELISQRVAAGLDIRPTRSCKKHLNSDSLESLDNASKNTKGGLTRSNEDKSVDWKKWGNRVAIGKSVIGDIKRLKPGSPRVAHEAWPPRHPIIPGAIGIVQPKANTETHTYPCQYGSAPGLLTLTHNTLLFIPLMSQNAKLIIPLAAVKGVKKAGLLKGLNIRWCESVDGVEEEKEEKFGWVGSRDELFARLVGSDGRRWMKV